MRKTFGFKDSYEVNEELKRGGWEAASKMASDEPSEGEQRRARLGSQMNVLEAEAAKQLEAAEEYAQSLSSLPWASVNKVIERVVGLRDEVIDLAEMCQSTMDPTGDAESGIKYSSAVGPLTVKDGENGSKILSLVKDEDHTTVVVEISEADQTVTEKLTDGSSISLTHGDNILTESFNDGCVSRLDRKSFLKTIQLAPSDGNILIQAVLNGSRKGHLTIQCMDGTCVIIDEAGNRTQRLASPRSRRRSSVGSQSPRARPPKGRPPSSPTGRSRTRTASTDLNVPGGDGPNRRQSRGSLFRQLTAEKLVVPARPDEEDAPDLPGGDVTAGEGKIQWRCIRRLWIHSKPATLSGLVRKMEIGETIVQVRANA